MPSAAPERKLGGTGRLVLGFVLGALFVFAPMYAFYMGREAALRANHTPDQVLTPPAEIPRTALEPPRNGVKAFASRLTYELSQLPEEPLVVPVRAPAVVASAATPAADEARVVSNARPISAVPPPARDRTQAIEQEAQRPEYRERPGGGPQPRVFEGREVDLKAQPKLPDTPTRPIVANTAVNTRAEIESERARLAAEVARAWPPAPEGAPKQGTDTRMIVATAPHSSPIGRAPDASTQKEPEARSAPSGALAAGGESVESRFAATREWLSGAPQTTHTIQLMGTNSEEQLRAQLKALSKSLEPGKIFVFRTVAQGKPSITVVYGAYADRKAALEALEKLPPSLTANKPVLRTVNGIRTEMKQHKTDS